jgi:hypothetical protein
MNMTKFAAFALLLTGTAGIAGATIATPEIDPATGGSALALLTGALLVIRSRRKN